MEAQEMEDAPSQSETVLWLQSSKQLNRIMNWNRDCDARLEAVVRGLVAIEFLAAACCSLRRSLRRK